MQNLVFLKLNGQRATCNLMVAD